MIKIIKWETIKDFDNFEISNTGIVRNKINKKEKSQIYNEKGYKRVTFYKNGKNVNKYVHRLVAEAFIPNPENKPTVNHIDGNKSNNNVENLEWATYKEQNAHSLKIGLIKIGKDNPCYGRKLSNETRKKMKSARYKNRYKFYKKIDQYDLEGNYIKTWDSVQEAINFYNNKAIEFVCVGKRNKASGYKWKFTENN